MNSAGSRRAEAYHLPFSDLGLACLRRDILLENAEVAQFQSDNLRKTGWSAGRVSLNPAGQNRGSLFSITDRCNLARRRAGLSASLPLLLFLLFVLFVMSRWML